MSETEEPKKKVTPSKSRLKLLEVAENVLVAYEQDKAELGEDAKEEIKQLIAELAAIKVKIKEQEEHQRKFTLATEEVEGLLASISKRRANVSRLASNKFGVQSTRAKSYRAR
jgi:hypothetical protein